MADGPLDLIRFEGHGTSVVLRITGPHDVVSPQMLHGEFLVESQFVRGGLNVTIFPEDLWEWRDALDGLDAGHDVGWREDARGASMVVERADDLAHVTIRNGEGSAVTVTVPLTDQWFDDAYDRLDLIVKTWSLAES